MVCPGGKQFGLGLAAVRDLGLPAGTLTLEPPGSVRGDPPALVEPLLIGLRRRHRILERRDPVAIVRFAAAERVRPPLLTNEREPLVECLAVLAVPDPRVLRATLDRHYHRRGPGLWVEEHDLAGGETILRARLRLHEGRLRVDARSEARLDRVLGLLSHELPDLAVIWDRRDPVTAAKRVAEP